MVNNLRDISIDKIRNMSQMDQRMMQMFYVSIWNKAADWNSSETVENIESLVKSPTRVNEIIEMLEYN